MSGRGPPAPAGGAVSERLAIAGSGAIACGLAATAAHHGPVRLLARSQDSAERAREQVEKALRKAHAQVDPEHVSVVTEADQIADATFVVEAVVEDHEVKAALLASLHEPLDQETILATTTSSLSIEHLAREGRRPARFVGRHVINPVANMKAVERVFPASAGTASRGRAVEL